MTGIGIPISQSNTERMNSGPKLLFGEENRRTTNSSADVMTPSDVSGFKRADFGGWDLAHP